MKLILLFLVALIFIINPVAATVIADFEGYECSSCGFVHGGGTGSSKTTTYYEGSCGYYVNHVGSGDAWAYKDIDTTGYDTIKFYAKRNGYWNHGAEIGTASIGSDFVQIYSYSWGQYTLDISSLSGVHRLYINCTSIDQAYMHYDYFVLDTLPSKITWTTHPADSWAKGNYSTLVVSVPDTLEFDFYYKNPSNDDYVLTPIQKSIFGRHFNVSENCFYQDYIKTCYHANHGNYSAKLQINSIDSSVTTRYIPYFDPAVTLPPVVIIPIPDVYVNPPQWDVEIPPAYNNVTWLIDYTDFWDGLGNSTNYTLYATVGLLFVPLDMVNNTISTICDYATDASGMISGFEHCTIIVKSAWELIPIEIQNIFIGSAALGLVVFLYKRKV